MIQNLKINKWKHGITVPFLYFLSGEKKETKKKKIPPPLLLPDFPRLLPLTAHLAAASQLHSLAAAHRRLESQLVAAQRESVSLKQFSIVLKFTLIFIPLQNSIKLFRKGQTEPE